MKLKLHTKIYYTGDRANIPDFGKITAVNVLNSGSETYNVTLDDGRVFKCLPPCAFDPEPGRRFIPRDEYEADRKAKLAMFFGPKEPPNDPMIFNKRHADDTFPPLSEFFDKH